MNHRNKKILLAAVLGIGIVTSVTGCYYDRADYRDYGRYRYSDVDRYRYSRYDRDDWRYRRDRDRDRYSGTDWRHGADKDVDGDRHGD
jgi:hypothetical protein